MLPPELNATYVDNYSLLRNFLQTSAPFVDPTINTMTITTWNEWHEDTEVEPMAAGPPSSAPSQYTQGYTYYSPGYKPLQILKSFKDSWGH